MFGRIHDESPFGRMAERRGALAVRGQRRRGRPCCLVVTRSASGSTWWRLPDAKPAAGVQTARRFSVQAAHQRKQETRIDGFRRVLRRGGALTVGGPTGGADNPVPPSREAHVSVCVQIRQPIRSRWCRSRARRCRAGRSAGGRARSLRAGCSRRGSVRARAPRAPRGRAARCAHPTSPAAARRASPAWPRRHGSVCSGSGTPSGT